MEEYLEQLKLKRDILQTVYDALVLGETGINNLSREIDKLDAKIEMLDSDAFRFLNL